MHRELKNHLEVNQDLSARSLLIINVDATEFVDVEEVKIKRHDVRVPARFQALVRIVENAFRLMHSFKLKAL